MLSDESIVDITRELDNKLAELGEKYQISPLSLSAVTLARIMRLTMEESCGKEFRQLMGEALVDTSQLNVKRTVQ